MARDEREADAAVVQEDAGGGLDEVRPEVQRVRLRQRDSEAVGVLRAQVCGVAVAETGHVGGGWPGAGVGAAGRRHVGRRHLGRVHPRCGGGQALGMEERVAVGAVEEHGRSVVADGAPRLDEKMGPLGIVGNGPEAGRLGHHGPGQREIALRGGWHGPQVVPPRVGAQWGGPRCCAGGEVGGREVPVAEVEEAPAELPLVEALAAVAGDGAQRAGDAGEAHGLADGQRPVGAQLAGTGEGVHEMAGQRQHERSGKALLGQFDGGGEDIVERQPPVALVQGEPAVDGAGHLHAAYVAAHGHRRQAVAAQPLGVGPRTGPADGEERLGWRPRRRHHRQQVASEPAQVRAHDGHCRPRGDGGIGG